MSMFLMTAVLALVLGIAGCDVEQDDNADISAHQAQDAAVVHPAREYQGTGQVISIERESAMLVIAHAPIPGLELTEARTQFLVAKPEELDDLQTADRVHFVLVRDNKDRLVVRGVWKE